MLKTQVEDWRTLHQKVQKSLSVFKDAWENIAASVNDELWTTSRRVSSKQDPPTVLYDAQLISPGSTALVPLEHDFSNITIHAIEHQRQNQLCQILVKVCEHGQMGVTPELIHKLKNGITFVKIEIREDKNFVRQVLRDHEVSFYVKIETKKGQQVLKYFSVDLNSHRQRRQSQRGEWSIDREDLFPDYNQHKCCACESGCGPVAWAQILAYYDRLAHYNTSLGYSKNFWKCSDGTANNCTAPKTMNSNVKKYIEGIRSKLGTFCLFGGGATTPRNMKKISDWYSARGIKGRVVGRYGPLSLFGITYPAFKKSAESWLKERYPVILGFWNKGFSMHYAVATRYKERQQKYRRCFLSSCRTKVKVQGSFYMHMGWGGTSNGWYSKNTFAVYSAKKYWRTNLLWSKYVLYFRRYRYFQSVFFYAGGESSNVFLHSCAMQSYLSYTSVNYAMYCYTLLCYAIPRLCYTTVYHVMQCYPLLCYASSCYAILYNAIQSFPLLYYCIPSYAMLPFAMLCFLLLCYTLLCYYTGYLVAIV